MRNMEKSENKWKILRLAKSRDWQCCILLSSILYLSRILSYDLTECRRLGFIPFCVWTKEGAWWKHTVVFMTGFQHVDWNLESQTLIFRYHPIRREVLPGRSNPSQPLSSAPEASAPVDPTTKPWIVFSHLANGRHLNTFYVPSFMLVSKEKPVTKRSDGRGCSSECPWEPLLIM